MSVADLTEDLLGDGSALREVLPEELADALPAREGDSGRFRRKLGHALRQRVERRFGEEDLFLVRSDDRHKKVALWRVRRRRERRERRGSGGAVFPQGEDRVSREGQEPGPALFPLNPAPPLDAESSPADIEPEEPAGDQEPEEVQGLYEVPSLPVTTSSSPYAEGAYRLIHDPETLVQALDALRNCTVIGIDTETTGLDPWTDRLRLIQLAAPGWPVLVIDLWQIPEDGRAPLRRFLTQPSRITIFHNGKFDLTFLQHAGLEVQGPLCDTMLASQLLDAGLHTRRHGLADVVQHFLHTTLSKDEQGSDWNGELTLAQLQYAATDAAILIPLRDVLLRDLRQAGLEEAARLEWDCLPAVAEMELQGIGVDQPSLRTLCQQLDVETTQAADALTALLHTPQAAAQAALFPAPAEAINLDSPAQVLHALQALG